MKRLLLLGCQLLLISGCQVANASDTNLDEAEALLDAMQARQSYIETAEQLAPFLPPNTISAQELHGRIYNEMARIYSEVYSAAELQALSEFFESSIGQAFLDRKPNSLQFLSGSHANRNYTNLAEAEALLNVMRVRQTLGQVAGQFPVDSSAPNATGSQDFDDNLYRGMVRAYAQEYTAQELQEMRDFFESPAGQVFLDKKPLLTERYLEVVRNMLTEIQNDMTGME